MGTDVVRWGKSFTTAQTVEVRGMLGSTEGKVTNLGSCGRTALQRRSKTSGPVWQELGAWGRSEHYAWMPAQAVQEAHLL